MNEALDVENELGVDVELDEEWERELELELCNVLHKCVAQCFHIHGHKLSLQPL